MKLSYFGSVQMSDVRFTNDGSVDDYVPGQNRRSRVTWKDK